MKTKGSQKRKSKPPQIDDDKDNDLWETPVKKARQGQSTSEDDTLVNMTFSTPKKWRRPRKNKKISPDGEIPYQ